MDSRLIWVVLVFFASIIIIEVDLNNEVSTDVPYPFNLENSSYPERRWNITYGPKQDIMKDNHNEDCFHDVDATRLRTFHIRGPLCELCSQIIQKKFPPKKMMEMKYASFLHGFLTFDPEEDYTLIDNHTLIDVVLCNYNTPNTHVGRFCVTRGKEESSVYFLKSIGTRFHKNVFTLDGYLVYSNNTSDKVTSGKTN